MNRTLNLISLLSLILILNVRGQAAAPAAPLESPEAMEPEAYNGLMQRLNLEEVFEAGTPKGGSQSQKTQNTQKPNTPAKKRDEFDETAEEKIAREAAEAKATADAAAGGAGDKKELDWDGLQFSAEQKAAIETVLTAGEGEIDPVALKLTDEQVAALQAHVAAADETPAAVADQSLEELGLTAEQKSAVEKMLAGTGDTVKLKKDLETAAAEKAALEKKLAEKPVTGTQVVALHPTLLINEPAKLAARERELINFEKWAVDNWDGSPAVEASADGKTPAVRAYTAAEIRSRYSQLKEEREMMIPKARELIAYTQNFDEQYTKKAYPELFDAKSTEAGLMNGMLAKMPGILAVLPNFRMIFGDALRGEKLRVEAAKKLQKVGGITLKNGKAAPKLPTSISVGRAPARKPAKADDTLNAEEFVKRGGNRAALVEMLKGTTLVN